MASSAFRVKIRLNHLPPTTNGQTQRWESNELTFGMNSLRVFPVVPNRGAPTGLTVFTASGKAPPIESSGPAPPSVEISQGKSFTSVTLKQPPASTCFLSHTRRKRDVDSTSSIQSAHRQPLMISLALPPCWEADLGSLGGSQSPSVQSSPGPARPVGRRDPPSGFGSRSHGLQLGNKR